MNIYKIYILCGSYGIIKINTRAEVIILKPIKLENQELIETVKEGKTPYVQIGKHKFLLFEVDQVTESDYYEVTDPEEKKQLLKALKYDNPVLTDTEVNEMLEP